MVVLVGWCVDREEPYATRGLLAWRPERMEDSKIPVRIRWPHGRLHLYTYVNARVCPPGGFYKMTSVILKLRAGVAGAVDPDK